MIGQNYVKERLNNLGPSNEYYFEVVKSDGTTSQNGDNGLDLAEPPVKILIDFAVDFNNEERKEEITRYSLQNRVVKVFMATKKKVETEVSKVDSDEKEKVISYVENEPVEIGSFVINSLNVNWDLYDTLKKNPLALKGLIDICTAYHLGNLLPSQN